MRDIYITHCTYKKDDSRKGVPLTPDQLYTGQRIQRFMQRCKEKERDWAIFSDLYGVWFQNEKHEWYEKHPKNVTEKELETLIEDTEKKLKGKKVYFYANHNSSYFHPLYRRLLDSLDLDITRITHLSDI